MTISREPSENAPSKPVILYPRPTAFSAHPLISVDRAADELIDALLSESLLELAWEEHGFRGPLGTIGKARNALLQSRLIERIDAVLPMPNAPVMLALDAAPVGGKAGTTALDLKIILIPQRHLALRPHRHHRMRNFLDQVAVDGDEPDAALRPQRGADAGRAAAPIVAGKHSAPDMQHIHQRDQVGADRRLLPRARCRLEHAPGLWQEVYRSWQTP